MPWERRQLISPDGTGSAYGLTAAFVTVDCVCDSCCDEWYISDLNVDVEIKIFIDTYAHIFDELGWGYVEGVDTVEGTYGHEQRHARRMVLAAENVFPALFSHNPDTGFGKGIEGLNACQEQCDRFVTVHQNRCRRGV